MISRATRRSILILTHDLIMAGLAFILSLYLRLGSDLWDYPAQVVELGLTLFVGTAFVVFLFVRLDRSVWRYSSFGDLTSILRAVAIVISGFLAVQFVVTRLEDLPRSFLVINFLMFSGLLALPRFGYRVLKDGAFDALFERERGDRVPVLLIGAGDGTDLFAREMARGRNAPYRVVGILDDRDTRTGRRIQGIEVMGGLDDLEKVVETLEGTGLRPQHLILTRREVEGALVSELFERADRLGLAVSRMPRLTSLEKANEVPALRPINVGDVLGRPQVTLDRDAMKALISGKRVLVTGAGGTIGSELVRQIAGLGPSAIALYEQSEYALYKIDLELSELAPTLERHPCLGDVRERKQLAQAFQAYRPELVFHAAALKHVPLMEINPVDAALTNAVGTRIVADTAQESGVELMLLISTDKAVNPTNVMGATKRLAEAWCQNADKRSDEGGGTRFVTVRFGNVLGSTGSVVPLFQRQLERGGPLTVTHPEMTRYFMTVREAVELVLQAASLGADETETRGRIAVLDMGEPVRIVELAEQMIRLAGLEPGRDIQISFTGLRLGEKLYEELFHDAEKLEATTNAAIRLAAPRTADPDLLKRKFDALEQGARERDQTAVRAVLAELVPEYQADTESRST